MALQNYTDVDGLPVATVSRENEFVAFDLLGPKTREALNAASIKFSASHLLFSARMSGLDPTNPAHDRLLARSVINDDRRYYNEVGDATR